MPITPDCSKSIVHLKHGPSAITRSPISTARHSLRGGCRGGAPSYCWEIPAAPSAAKRRAQRWQQELPRLAVVDGAGRHGAWRISSAVRRIAAYRRVSQDAGPEVTTIFPTWALDSM